MVSGVGIQARAAEIRRGWERKNDGFVSYFVHRTERVEIIYVGGRPGIPARYRWQLVGDGRFDGAIYVRLADALRAVPAPAMSFGGGKRVERLV